MLSHIWFDTWDDIARVLLVGASAYIALVTVLRVSGKRTLAKLNAFDLVVTVAVGSTLATILLNSDVSFVEGVVALALLAALQFVAASMTARLTMGRAVLTSRPTVLMIDGRFDEDVMRRERVSAEEICHAIRSSGHGDVKLIGVVILESDGSLSVIPIENMGDRSALLKS